MNRGIHTSAQIRWCYLLLSAAILYAATGLCTNIMRAGMMHTSPILVELTLAVFLLAWTIFFAAAGLVGLSRDLPSFVAWGFVIDRKLWISVVLIVITGAILIHRYPGTIWSYESSMPWKVGGATLEEIVCRGVFINSIVFVVRPRSKWTVAVLLCAAAALWAAAHIPTKSLVEIWGLFTSGVALGYIYYYTRSLLFPIFSHVTANAGMLGGVVGVVGYFVVSVLVHVLARSRRTSEARPT
ncbi:MAG: CPBP family glutamic-type intramembrane protease [Candidatus Zixiibacteriota bacterium]